MRQIQLFRTNQETGKTEEFVAISFAEEISRGIDFLDREMGQAWPSVISPKKLDLADASYCVCGQVFENEYTEGLRRLNNRYGSIADRAGEDMTDLAYRWGFSIPPLPGSGFSSPKSYRDSKIAWDWAVNYASDGAAQKYEESSNDIQWAADKVLWSALTEAWLHTIKDLKAERGLH